MRLLLVSRPSRKQMRLSPFLSAELDPKWRQRRRRTTAASVRRRRAGPLIRKSTVRISRRCRARPALPTLDAVHHAVPGTTVVSNCGEKVVLAGLLSYRRTGEMLQGLTRCCNAALQIVKGGTQPLEQDGLAELIGLQRRRLDGSQENPRLTFAE